MKVSTNKIKFFTCSFKGAFVLILSFLFSISLSAQTKHALIIAISQYEQGNNWKNLNCNNDVVILKKALISRGFEEKNISVYDQSVTKEIILNAIDQHLVNNVMEGDIGLFHFSGHGQQISDKNGDEADGLDEALVAFNGPSENKIFSKELMKKVPYEYQHHVSDDELGLKLRAIRKKLGKSGNLFVSIDACHSATVTRGDFSNTRGSTMPNVPDGWVSKNGAEVNLMDAAIDENNLAPMVSFYASKANQLNTECMFNGTLYGPLSLALSKTMATAGSTVSYRALFDLVKIEMAKVSNGQTPIAEGSLDQEIFGGKLLENIPHYAIVRCGNFSNKICINGGTLQNILPGTKIGFYPPDTRDLSKVQPLVIGIVENSELLGAQISVEDNKNVDANAWIHVLERNYGQLGIKVKIDANDLGFRQMLFASIEKSPYIKLVNENHDILIEEKKGKCVMIHSSSYIMDETNLASTEAEIIAKSILEKIRQCAQASYLQNLSLEADGELLQVEVLDNRNNKLSSPNLYIKEGDTICYRVINKSIDDLYLTFLEFTPDFAFAESNIVFPSIKRPNVEEYIVKAMGQRDFEVSIARPFGTNQILVLGSKQPVYLRELVKTRGNPGKGSNQSIENLIKDSYLSKEETRSGQTRNGKVNEYEIASRVFTIIPKS